MKKKSSYKKILYTSSIIVIGILYFLFKIIAFNFADPDSTGFGFDGFMAIIWIKKIIDFVIMLFLIMLCCIYKGNMFYKVLIRVFFIYNTIMMLLCCIFSTNPDLFDVYVVAFICSLLQITIFGDLKKADTIIRNMQKKR